MEIEYIGKCLFVKTESEKTLVIGDLHLGYSSVSGVGGLDIDSKLYEETFNQIEKTLKKTGKVNRLIFLGDLKHSIGELEKEERYGIVNLFDGLKKIDRDMEIIVIRGNHDNFLVGVIGKNARLGEYFILDEMCFIHGDREFEIMKDKKIKYWVMGHLHPAIRLASGNKSEKYKCFFSGRFKGKIIIILPSFSEHGVGSEYEEIKEQSIWSFELLDFDVFVVSENLKVLNFGKLKSITS